MTYNPSIPQSTDLLSQSQGQILTNFTQANTLFSTDHVAFTDNTNGGEHKKVLFNNIASDPALTSPKTQLYTKASTNATVNDRFNDLYYSQRNVTGTSNVLQMTGGGITAAAWVRFVGATAVITASYNVTSVIRSSAGIYVINFTRPFIDTNFICVGGLQSSIGVQGPVFLDLVGAPTTSSWTVNTIDDSGAALDSPLVCLTFFGTLA